MNQGFGDFVFLLGAGWGLRCAGRCRAGDGAGFKCVLLDTTQYIKLNNNQKYPKLI